MKVIQRVWYVQHVGVIFLKNPPEAAKVATSVKVFNVGKTLACYPHQDFEIQFFSTLLNTYVYLHVSFSAVDIVLLKEEKIFNKNILMMVTTISFFG